MITDAAMSVSANSTLLNAIHDILPEMYKFVPERVGPLRKKLSIFEQTLNKEQRSSNEYSSLMRSGSPEDMLAGSLKADDDERQMLRQQAIGIAILRRRADALREFIKNEIADDSLQRSFFSRRSILNSPLNPSRFIFSRRQELNHGVVSVLA